MAIKGSVPVKKKTTQRVVLINNKIRKNYFLQSFGAQDPESLLQQCVEHFSVQFFLVSVFDKLA